MARPGNGPQCPHTRVDTPAQGPTLGVRSEGSSGRELRNPPRPENQRRAAWEPFEPDPGHAGEGTGHSVSISIRLAHSSARPAAGPAAAASHRQVLGYVL